MSEDESGETVSWIRGPKKADLSKVPLDKIQKAHEERGLNVEVNADRPNQSKVTKTIIKGIPVSKSSEES